ncbi:dynactin subunit 2-like [Macrosteles quadrilineatus]|uniref:dynactin subunit 2-like n=1 Tax=Macrosteles quadrilineatus TaxID=74068 RepID=UPI0023E0F5BE|nr:dynactin subunit 2-like [Macrosteles quadrilineatus]
MADPKYANLVGIAYDQPDVYETKDLPEADQNAEIFEEESDSIERLHISATNALSKFKGKRLDASRVDFSDRLGKQSRTGYDARYGDWELAGDGEKETPIQKYQRLQCEVKELLDEVANLKETAKDETNKQSCIVVGRHAQDLVQQLTEMRLEEQLGVELVASLSDPQGAQIKKLLSQLEQFQAKRGGGDHHSKGEGVGSEVKFQMMLRPGHAQLAQTARLADLEQRLARVEQAVGNTPAKLSRLGLGEGSLMTTTQQLAGRAALLDAAALDAAETRLSSLLTKLDQVAEKTAAITGSSDPDRDKKINELYELAKKAEYLSLTLPQTLDRLIALQNLHQQGGEFAKSLSEMESVQVQLAAKMRANSELLASVEEGLKTNFTTIKTDLESLDSRIKGLSSKK